MSNSTEPTEPCAWCGRLYRDHETYRAPNAPVPRAPCLLLKSGYRAKLLAKDVPGERA
jgi:hypothetical protein